jgi:hypothetical protein
MPIADARDRSSGADYAVGYGKPPLHTRFVKGKSGNPAGRPRGATSLARAKALALEEAYRLVTVREGRNEVKMPAIQAVLRRQIALAAQGNGPAQRAVIAAVLAIEEEEAQLEAERRAREAELNKPANLIDAARRICYLLRIARDEEDKIVGRQRQQADAPGTPAANAAGGANVPKATCVADAVSAGTPPSDTPSANTPFADASSANALLAGADCAATSSAIASSAGAHLAGGLAAAQKQTSRSDQSACESADQASFAKLACTPNSQDRFRGELSLVTS